MIVPVVAPAAGAADRRRWPSSRWSRLSERRARLDTLRDNAILEQRVRERTDELWQTQLEVVRRLGRAVDWRDGDTGEHVDRIGRFCERLGSATGMEASRPSCCATPASSTTWARSGSPTGS